MLPQRIPWSSNIRLLPQSRQSIRLLIRNRMKTESGRSSRQNSGIRQFRTADNPREEAQLEDSTGIRWTSRMPLVRAVRLLDGLFHHSKGFGSFYVLCLCHFVHVVNEMNASTKVKRDKENDRTYTSKYYNTL